PLLLNMSPHLMHIPSCLVCLIRCDYDEYNVYLPNCKHKYMQKRWVEKPQQHSEQVRNLSNSLNINSVLASLLVKRGIHSYQDAENFFCPDLARLYDPFLMRDMDKAVSRIIS